MAKKKETEETMKFYGWSEQKESTFFKNTQSFFGGDYKGTFTIKRVKGKWFWYYKFSSHKITPRTKYLCSCEVKTDIGQTSFEHASQILSEKIKHNFTKKKVIDSNLSNYINEFIDKCMVDGGLTYEERSKGKIKYKVLTFSGYANLHGRKNTSTMKRHVRALKEFNQFCIDKKVKTKSVIKEDFRDTFHEYFMYLVNRNKRNRKGFISPNSSKSLEPSSIKINLQSVRGFLNWLCTPKSEDGKGLFKIYHDITSDYQNHLLRWTFGRTQPDDKIINFDTRDYEKCVKELTMVIYQYWTQYVIRKGDREDFRKMLSYQNPVTSTPHRNQPKDVIIMSDIVYFVSFLQLTCGFRITEILHSFRNKEAHDRYTDTTKVSSFFQKMNKKDGSHYYILDIRNSKNKAQRIVPIDETIKTAHKPPKGVPCKIKQGGNEKNFYYTNIIDIIFELFHPKNHPMTFPSPNLSKKAGKGYSTTYYINLFKEKLVLDKKYNWRDRGIESTHNLRLFFASYLLKEGVNPTAIGEVSGQSLGTIMKYYNRLSLEGQMKTLQHTDMIKILSKTKGYQ